MAEGDDFRDRAGVSTAAELPQVEIRERKILVGRGLRRHMTTNRKKPGAAGLFDELLF
jgi:hypothetical protein